MTATMLRRVASTLRVSERRVCAVLQVCGSFVTGVRGSEVEFGGRGAVYKEFEGVPAEANRHLERGIRW